MEKDIKALVTRGKKRGQEVTISQWCNDWFSTMDGEIMSPLSLAFTPVDARIILDHKNNGILFRLYRFAEYKAASVRDTRIYIFTFVKNKR